MLKVLYEDNHLIAVYKPAGVLVQGDKTGDLCLMDEVKEYLKKKYDKKGNIFLGLLHRLDRPVSGVILFAKTSKGASRLSEQFRNHTIEKIYHALVEGRPKKEKANVVSYLIKDKGNNVVKVFDHKEVGALDAKLYYEVIKTNGKYSLLRVELETGRPHQIRAQLSHAGHPIVGDMKYGSSTKYDRGAIALMATNLAFDTATTKERINIEVAPEFNFKL